MKPKKLKTPQDYEIFSFRVNAEEKSRLNSEIEVVEKLYTKKRIKGERAIRKSDIIIEAIENGLPMILRKLKSK